MRQFGSLKDRIKQKAAEKAAEKAGKKIGEAMGDKPATDAAQPAAPSSNTVTSNTSTAPTSRREWANYDFVPGARTIYFTDFAEDQVGNFPKRLTFKSGQMEVVELDGGQRALKASKLQPAAHSASRGVAAEVHGGVGRDQPRLARRRRQHVRDQREAAR